MLAPADDCVTVMVWLPSMSWLPATVPMPYWLPPLASRMLPLGFAICAVVLLTVPLLTKAEARASLFTTNDRLPPTASLVTVAVTEVGSDDTVFHTLQPTALVIAPAPVPSLCIF